MTINEEEQDPGTLPLTAIYFFVSMWLLTWTGPTIGLEQLT